MRTLSNLWTMLAARDTTRLETVAVINGTEYSTITPPVANHSLLAGDMLTVGNCVASTLSFTVMTTNTIPKSAKVVIKCRLVDGSVYTSWYEFGTFYISKREVDDDLVSLECYDAMLKGNQPYGGSSDAMNWPKAMTTVVNTIASRMGVQLDSRTVINSNSNVYKCEYPGDKTLLEVLGYIGACHGGNWIITPENKLRLVPLTGSGNTVNVPVVLSQITTAKAYSITGVTMSIDEDNVFTAGNSSGYMLTIDENPYANQTITNNLYNALRGLNYQPFFIAGAIYDPAAELGDTIVIGDIRSVLISETRNYDIGFRASAEAPGEDEAEDEYPYPSALKRLQRSIVRSKEETYSKIEQTQSDIMFEVGKKVNKDGIVAQINLGLEKDGSGSYIKISADHLDLSGCAKFTDLSNPNNYTVIDGANIRTGTVTADRLNSAVITSISNAQSAAETAQSTADGSNAREQYIYISKATGTTSVSSNTTWVTDSTGNQNRWTTKRPEYSRSYPVLFIAKQSQTVKQKKAGSTCECTTPAIDKTTTVIDGGNIITYSITADQIAAHTITGAEIKAGSITATEIDATNLHVKGANIDDTLSASKIYGGTLTLGGSNNKNGSLSVKDSNDSTIGTFDRYGITLYKGDIYFDRSSSIITYLTDDKNSYVKLSGSQSQTSGTGVGLYYRYGDATARFNVAGTYNVLAPNNYYYDAELYMSGCYNRRSSIKSGYFDFTNPNFSSGVFNHSQYTDVMWNGNTFEVYGEKSLYVRVRSKDDTGLDISNGNRMEWGGDFYVYGTKSRVVTTDQYKNRFLYCYETPSPMFGDVGEGIIAEDGLCYIWFDPIFAQTISTKQYQVFLQKYSEGNCHVSKRDGSYFVVEGTPGLAFGWEAKAKQRDYEELRLEEDGKPIFSLQIPQYGTNAAAHIAQIRKEREVA